MTSTAISAQGSTVAIGTASTGAKTITAITQGNPAVVTSNAHGLVKGDIGAIAGVVGMTQLNGQTAVVQYTTPNSFALANVDSTGYTAYSSGGTFTPTALTPIANVKSFTGFDGSSSEIDTTNLASLAKEFRLGLVDSGQFSIELDQDNTDPGQIALLAAQVSGAQKQFRLTLPNGSSATFNGFVKKLSSAGGVDAVVKRSCDIRITGPVTWA